MIAVHAASHIKTHTTKPHNRHPIQKVYTLRYPEPKIATQRYVYFVELFDHHNIFYLARLEDRVNASRGPS